jgi:hypothetical protein
MIFKCKFCNKEVYHNRFRSHIIDNHDITPQEYFDQFILDDIKNKTCVCGKEKKFLNVVQGYAKTCGNEECAHKAYEQTCMERYGCKNGAQLESTQEKMRATCVEKYGVTHANKRPEFKEKMHKAYKIKHQDPELGEIKRANNKRKETCLKLYGVDNTFKSEEIKTKIKSTTRIRHGVENISQSEEAKDKKLQKVIKKTGSKNPFTKEERKKGNIVKAQKSFKLYLDSNFFEGRVTPLFHLDIYEGGKNKYRWKCAMCNHEFKERFKGTIPLCPKCFPYGKGSSKWEREVFDFVSSYVPTEHNIRFYYKGKKFYELDIFIPSLNIGIECDGVKHHSERFGGKDKNYHINKTNFFKEKGIKVYHFYDIEWASKQDLVKSIILSKLNFIKNKIFARKCKIKEISFYECNVFLDKNHLQGKCISSVRYGLFYDNVLISVMTFGKSRFNKKYDWELLRYSSALNTTVVGGFSRLLSFFIKNNKGNIISYADKRISFGEVYLKNNFLFVQESSPSYYYFNSEYILKNRIGFQKHKLQNTLSIYKAELSEWENMQLNGYDRIWDCGTLAFAIE